MATKSKLTKAMEEQVRNLDPAQREIILAEYETYRFNLRKIREIENKLDIGMDRGEPLDDARERALITKRHQLVTENTSVSTKLIRNLKGTAVEEDELDAFLRGN